MKREKTMQIEDILNRSFELKAADIFLVGGSPIVYKVNGKLVKEGERLEIDELNRIIKGLYAMIKRDFKGQAEKTEDDFSFSLSGLARFRCNVLYQRGSLSAVIRMLQFGIPSPEEMNIPSNILDVADYSMGLALVSGTVGSGKSTTIACIIDKINKKYEKNIITIEDPIEFLHRHEKGIVIQREVPTDTPSFPIALRSSLREAPDVLFVGEMRDSETMATSMTAAETGRLVISTLHTLSAADTIDRIVDSFPPIQQNQIRFQLSRVLRCVICQQLVPGIDGKLYPAFEILKVNSAVANLIREGKVYQLPSVIQTHRRDGMITMQDYLNDMVARHIIDKKTAYVYGDEIQRQLSLM